MSQLFVSESNSGGGDIQTIQGNSGGPIGPNSSGQINIVGIGGTVVAGNPATNTLTITGVGSVLLNNQVTITSTQLKNAVGTPITLVAAQGAGTVIIPVSVLFKFTPGSNIFSNSPQMQLAYISGTVNGQQGCFPTSFLGSLITIYAQTIFGGINNSGNLNVPIADVENSPFSIQNNGFPLSGNPANDAVVVAATQYVILTL